MDFDASEVWVHSVSDEEAQAAGILAMKQLIHAWNARYQGNLGRGRNLVCLNIRIASNSVNSVSRCL